MLVGTHQRLATTANFNVSADSTNLERVEKFKYLGVFLDHTLSWKEHISYIVSKISSRLRMIRRARKVLPRSACITLYNSMVLPIFDYCANVWDSCGTGNKDYLERLQGHATMTKPTIPKPTIPEGLSKTRLGLQGTEQSCTNLSPLGFHARA